MAVEKKGKGKGKGVVLLWKTTLQGCLIGMLFGVLIGLLLGAPMSLVAYGSTKDAIKDGLLRKFSMDKNKTDIPDVVAAQYLEVCLHPSRSHSCVETVRDSSRVPDMGCRVWG